MKLNDIELTLTYVVLQAIKLIRKNLGDENSRILELELFSVDGSHNFSVYGKEMLPDGNIYPIAGLIRCISGES